MNENLIYDFKLNELEEWFVIESIADKEIFLITIFLLLAFFTVLLSKRFHIPVVVGYVFLGIILSPDILSLLPYINNDLKNLYTFILTNMNYITQISLAFIAFTIGSELSLKTIRRLGKSIFYIVIIQSFAAFGLVAAAVYFFGWPLYMGLLLGAIATATAPAATVMVIQEYQAEGPLTSTMMAVIGIDDAVALIVFSLISPIAFAQYKGGAEIHFGEMMIHPLIEITGAVIIGLVIGYLAQFLISGYNQKIKKLLSALLMILLSTSISIYMGFSPLIANMTVGFSVRNFAKKNLQISEYFETITIPLYALFFIIAGTEIRFSEMGSKSFFVIAAVYFIARTIGKIGGASLAAEISGAAENIKKYIGLGLLPQSGVAIALAYSVQKQYVEAPEIGLLIFNTLILTAAVTEIFGPLLTKYALLKSGEGTID
ncbi:cation:proton antiporter [Halanaerobium sp.]|jgi:Kef-type K+ transport system membrane component KefB|uniref:cation:proton antiporter n=1 Tax=Halanaerobium sp. TaxID=1895664 RepID=UPI000DE79DAD|nr:cation:proton antiporter [Halanaerobium sp.]PUU90075.1 MAG: sodium/hydrogen exchanger [Halanaerobium sp.]